MPAPGNTVLVIAGENYPPWTSPGSIRLAKTCELLVEHGWRSTVLCCRPPGGMRVRLESPSEPGVEVHRTIELDPAKMLFARPELRGPSAKTRRSRAGRASALAQRAYTALSFPDRDWLWIPVGIAAGRRLIRRRSPTIGALYSTSPSIAAHVVGRRLARATGLPWIAEFRDTWASSTIRPERGAVRSRLERGLERRLCRAADRVVSVSRDYLDELVRANGIDPSRTAVVHNGVDPRDFLTLERPERFDRFGIAHAGRLYGGRRGLTVVLDAMRGLIDDGRIDPSLVSVDLFGGHDAEVAAQVRAARLDENVRWHGYLTYPETLRRLAGSYLQLLVTHEAAPTLPSKLFDYIGVGRPTIAVAHETSETAAILRETGMGHVVAHHDTDRMRELLATYWQRWRAGDPMTPDARGVLDGAWTRQRQVAHLASLLDEACRGRHRGGTTENPRTAVSMAGRHG